MRWLLVIIGIFIFMDWYAPQTFSKNLGHAVIFYELKRRNWESHGTDIRIDHKGHFVVTAVFLGKTRKIREGILSPNELNALIDLSNKIKFSELQDEYKAPFKSRYSWWGYQLTVATRDGKKTIRFHSEDETVPQKLIIFVQRIMKFTR
jgi:hypothetical protein